MRKNIITFLRLTFLTCLIWVGISMAAPLLTHTEPVVSAQATEVIASGMVVPFNLATCPTGWSEFTTGRGRAIIGTNPSAGGGISARTLLSTGGAETHTLTVAEIPSHTHTLTTRMVYDYLGSFTINDGGSDAIASSDNAINGSNAWQRTNRYTSSAGGSGQAHDNMSPFVALLLCVKD